MQLKNHHFSIGEKRLRFMVGFDTQPVMLGPLEDFTTPMGSYKKITLKTPPFFKPPKTCT